MKASGMTREQRIRQARLVLDAWWGNAKTGTLWDAAEEIIDAAYPELVKGSHVIVPRKAVETGLHAVSAQITASWKPIETAPTDGTQFLACTEEYDMVELLSGPVHDNSWLNHNSGNYARRDAFTHWMPKPEPPKA